MEIRSGVGNSPARNTRTHGLAAPRAASSTLTVGSHTTASNRSATVRAQRDPSGSTTTTRSMPATRRIETSVVRRASAVAPEVSTTAVVSGSGTSGTSTHSAGGPDAAHARPANTTRPISSAPNTTPAATGSVPPSVNSPLHTTYAMPTASARRTSSRCRVARVPMRLLSASPPEIKAGTPLIGAHWARPAASRHNAWMNAPTDAVAPSDCMVVEVSVSPGIPVRAGATLVVVEVMKIEQPVTAPVDGTVVSVAVEVG
ncbi:MAG: hypothetical protein GWN79_06935, partial [Actinobacteria bacterium]|nr:hypothetical protein [Actinomycetota bacterium]NIS30602.1 hypothetical protein [Actinomycetota bacterium]NIT95170.1 hypothetical protein [Actinomycetota bacterium]NIU18840.1 hypothetical protein [Actinomycetota bacterium]NIU65805.1 hypothetical protein [Actinomycetota bacterium]